MERLKSDFIFVPEVGVIKAHTFSAVYPVVNSYLMNNRDWQPSRDGDVKEMMDIKTQITNPYRRCVGGYNRNINIFFLLAEAMWIACGKKDVKFLTIFNKKMADYSDNGEVFHAPYGFRLRHWGIRAEDKFIAGDASRGYDQVIDAIRILSENPNTRQVVMEIWNPAFDLGFKTKDIPCNDIIMLKIRDGKLITTIGNRSNDLHLGLPTNVFQFSFLTELIAATLGVELGTQTHNSQSLHLYSWNKAAISMHESYYYARQRGIEVVGDMYSECGAQERRIDFNFSHQVAVNRFREIEIQMNIIIDNLTRLYDGEKESEEEIAGVREFSEYLYKVYQLLRLFIEYNKKIVTLETPSQKDVARNNAISIVEVLELDFNHKEGRTDNFLWDITVLAKNYFFTRLSTKGKHEFLGRL